MNLPSIYELNDFANIELEEGITIKDTIVGHDIINVVKERLDAEDEESNNIYSLPPNVFTGRKEDMSSDGELRLFIEDDGDVIITVLDRDSHCASVQFCTVGQGGGSSPETLKALRGLIVAINKDNKDNEARIGRCG